MSKKELRCYFEWFQEVLPQRIDELRRAVQASPGFQTWQADLTPESLDLLGSWFASQVGIRLRTEDEIREIASRSSFPLDVPGVDLTNETFSLSMDIGMYLSQVFLKNLPNLRWSQPLRSKGDSDYGQPVLVGFGEVSFNPVSMLVTLAYGVVSKRKSGKSLRDLYDIWASMR